MATDRLINSTQGDSIITALQQIRDRLYPASNMIADYFSTSVSYAVGDLVVYDDKLYKCTTAHLGEWTIADFTQTTVEEITGGIQDEVNGLIDNVNECGCKNLLPYPYFHASGTVNRGITYTYDTEGVVNVNGTTSEANLDSFFSCINQNVIYKAGTYIVNGCPAGGSATSYWIVVYKNNVEIGRDYGEGFTFTITDTDLLIIQIRVYRNGYQVNNLKFKPMIRDASILNGDFVPYAETNRQLTLNKLSRADNGILGAKNFLPYPYRHTTRVSVGVTWTDNGDGTVTASTGSGGATGDSAFEINNLWSYADGFDLGNNSYLLNGFPSGSSSSTYYIQALYKDSSNNDQYLIYSENDSIIAAQGAKNHVGFRIIVKSGTVLTTPVTFKPMLRLPSDSDETYQPYAMTNQQLTEKVLNHETYYVKNGTVTSVANNTPTDIESTKITLPAGTYLLLATAEFQATSDVGTRKLMIKGSSTATIQEIGGNPAGYTLLSGLTFQTVSDNTDVYVRVNQSSGSAMNIMGYLRAIRII